MSARVRKRVAARRCVVITMEGDCAGTADLRTRPGELHEEDDRACSRPAYGRHCCTARRPEHAGQAASDADDVKVPNTDFTTVLCRRMPSIGPPSFRIPRVQPHCPAPRRFQETARPAMETSRRALQKVGVRRCAGRPLGRVIHDRAKGSEKPKATNVALDGLGGKKYD